MKRLVFLLLLLGGWIISVHAQSYDFVVSNQTGYVIYELYVSPSNIDNWEEDILGEDVLMNGDSYRITFSESLVQQYRRDRTKFFDMKVVDEDDDKFTYTQIDLTKVSKVILRIGDDGKGYIDLE
jgi:hypothetical protein